MKEENIELRGVFVHNLKKVNLKLPANRLIVFTGVSGSGKSSLAFDTIYVEGQRRYIESLSAHARRYLGDLPKPDAESIEGLTPTIAIEQKSISKNPRSTVGTITGVYDYLRVLFARLAVAYCPVSHERVSPSSQANIRKAISTLPTGTKLLLLAPYARGKKGEFKEDFAELLRKGFARVRVDKEIYNLSDDVIGLDKAASHDVDLIIDRLILGPEEQTRLLDSVGRALELGEGTMSIVNLDTKEEILYSEHSFSAKSGLYYKALEPEQFSFNHPQGMCEMCQGLGVHEEFDLDRIIDPELSISEDCCQIAGSYQTVKWGNIYNNLARIYKFKISTPWKQLPETAKDVFLYGTKEKWTRMRFVHPVTKKQWTDYVHWQGVIYEAKKRLAESKTEIYQAKIRSLMHQAVCPECHGSRIKPYPRAAKFFSKTISEVSSMTIDEARLFFDEIVLSENESIIGAELLQEVKLHLKFLYDVGLHYLTLDRGSPTLSGGESQRVRLASQISSGLVGTTYVLDEPSIGLHPRDNHRLLLTLHALKDKGNTVIVVEHDEETIRSADHIVDIGPGAGVLGGEIVSEGSFNKLLSSKRSLTADYLSGRKFIPIPKKRRKGNGLKITLKGASHHNLKNVNLSLPLGTMIAITGVSGSGKSSLITETLYPALANKLHDADHIVGKHSSIDGIDAIDKVIAIDQSPIGRTPRSNPATYIKLFDDIRDLFSELPESKALGFKPGRFSFNVKEGSCHHCSGMGLLKVDMDFLEDEWVTCPQCNGRRFDPRTLSIAYKGKTIHDVLEMSVNEAHEFFDAIPNIEKKLSLLLKVGLNYIKIGQSSTTLSGGEAQRIKLAKELIRPSTGKTLYILDEPTTGLHFYDIHKLSDIMQQLVDHGNTVLIIEHNMDLIKTADWIIDIGPEGGNLGGKIIATGTPEQIAKKKTPTGQYLNEISPPSMKKDGQAISTKSISVKGARQNNLKEVSLDIPRGKISVFTGPSGSGKTSMAFETIYAEGQRRYIESLSPYARQFVKQMPKPKVDEVEGLSPAIAIEQKSHTANPRSTVGTMTETYDLFRLLFARMGTPFCPDTGEEIKSISHEYVANRLLTYPEKTRMRLLAPLPIKRSESFEQVKKRLEGLGFLRIRLNGTDYEIDEDIPYDKRKKNVLDLVIDRIVITSGIKKRLLEAIEQASTWGEGIVKVALDDKELLFNLAFAVESTGKSYPPIMPQTFSFNSEHGMCNECLGLGYRYGGALDQDSSILRLTPMELYARLIKKYALPLPLKLFLIFLQKMNIDESEKIRSLSDEQKRALFEGSNLPIEFTNRSTRLYWKGIHQVLATAAKLGRGDLRYALQPLLKKNRCSACLGTRLNPLARHVKISDHSITDLCQLPLGKLPSFLEKLSPPAILKDLLETLSSKISFLKQIGLSYLSLDRSANTISGGENQRLRLARQLGSGLGGCLFVLDEPTIGLHPQDNHLLNASLKKLCSLNNTLLLVEHDPLTVEIADKIFEFGPNSGNFGGELIASGSVSSIKNNPKSLTGAYLSARKSAFHPKERRKPEAFFHIENASLHNLKDLSLKIPIGAITCITGVSGSGKSTLMHDLIKPAVKSNVQKRKPAKKTLFNGTTFTHLDLFDKVIDIDQSPMGQTMRSDIGTYSDLLTHLRSFFASLPDAKKRGLMPKHFSYHHKSGMCKTCRGLGFKKVELQFLPPVKVLCDTCDGNRLAPLSLKVTYKGKNLGQILKLTLEEAADFLPPIPRMMRTIDTLSKVGLSYLCIGQMVQTLSGGEAGRLRLSRELARRSTGKTLYLFDEPTTGLHDDDIAKLIPIFEHLVDKGNTIILIEHNLDVMACSDHIIDLGPEAGANGGQIIAKGTPEEVSKHKTSYTARFLAPYLEARSLNSSSSV